MLKKSLVVAVAALGLATIMASLSSAQGKKETVRQELNEHPRIHAAIRELEEAIKYMEAALDNIKTLALEKLVTGDGRRRGSLRKSSAR
jgi:hypothetical protein